MKWTALAGEEIRDVTWGDDCVLCNNGTRPQLDMKLPARNRKARAALGPHPCPHLAHPRRQARPDTASSGQPTATFFSIPLRARAFYISVQLPAESDMDLLGPIAPYVIGKKML